MNDPRDDRLEHDDLSDAERAAIEGTNDIGTEAATAAAAVAPAAAAPAPAQGDDGAASELREAANALTASAQAMQQIHAAMSQQQAQAAAEPATPPPAARDFNAELAALEARYDDGELDMKEFMRERDAVREAQLEARMEAKLQAQQSAAQAQALEQSWASAYTGFFSGADAQVNARLATDALKPGFDALAVRLIAEGKTFDQALTEARRQVFEQIGIPLPTATSGEDAVAKATAARQPAARPGPGLGDMPAAASLATGAAQELDNLPIEELEARIARMSPAEQEAYLASADGGLRDNPRG